VLAHRPKGKTKDAVAALRGADFEDFVDLVHECVHLLFQLLALLGELLGASLLASRIAASTLLRRLLLRRFGGAVDRKGRIRVVLDSLLDRRL